MISRRGFFGLLAGLVAAPRATWRDLWRPADLVGGRFHLPTELAKTKMCQPLPEASKKVVQFSTYDLSRPIPPHAGVVKCVIGQYADYYIEHDGMVERGPGCLERMQARIDALPDGDPRKMELRA